MMTLKFAQLEGFSPLSEDLSGVLLLASAGALSVFFSPFEQVVRNTG